MTSSEWNVVWDRRTADRWVWDRGRGRRQAGARARGGIARGGPVLCCFGVSEFESSRDRGENFFFFLFFLAKINFFLKEELGKQGFFRLNL